MEGRLSAVVVKVRTAFFLRQARRPPLRPKFKRHHPNAVVFVPLDGPVPKEAADEGSGQQRGILVERGKVAGRDRAKETAVPGTARGEGPGIAEGLPGFGLRRIVDDQYGPMSGESEGQGLGEAEADVGSESAVGEADDDKVSGTLLLMFVDAVIPLANVLKMGRVLCPEGSLGGAESLVEEEIVDGRKNGCWFLFIRTATAATWQIAMQGEGKGEPEDSEDGQ